MKSMELPKFNSSKVMPVETSDLDAPKFVVITH
jgi:hypothetical protein